MAAITILCGVGLIVSRVEWADLGRVWAYDAIGLVVLDAIKVQWCCDKTTVARVIIAITVSCASCCCCCCGRW
jgi:hypothetical protein